MRNRSGSVKISRGILLSSCGQRIRLNPSGATGRRARLADGLALEFVPPGRDALMGTLHVRSCSSHYTLCYTTFKTPDLQREHVAQLTFENRKDRVFLRAIQGEYSLKDELKRLRALPRVRRADEINFIDGPQAFSKHYLHPEDNLG